MKNIEYSKMAPLYDKFYANKNYLKEVDFITHFAKKSDYVLDAGCGTGKHAKILSDLGFQVYGFDQSESMVDIANSKIPKHFFVDDLLTFCYNAQYDIIISFFAVFNHLKNYKQFKTSLSNLKRHLKPNGRIIIDLHNPQKSGKKTESIENGTRIMKWKKCDLVKKEFTKIIYEVDGKTFKTKRVFKIYKIKKLRDIAHDIGFYSVDFYENYNTSTKASKKSKNVQMVLTI